MRKKIILLIIIFFALSGCTIDYSVNIKSGGAVYEKLYSEVPQRYLTELQPEDWSSIIGYYTRNEKIKNEYDESIAEYQVSLTKNHEDLDSYFNNKFFSKYVGSYTIDVADQNTLKVVFNESFISNVYGNGNIPPRVESLTVKVTIPYNVYESNASIVDGREYTWNLGVDNKLPYIYVKYLNPEKSSSVNKTAFNFVVIIIAVLLVLAAVYIKIKNKKNNAL